MSSDPVPGSSVPGSYSNDGSALIQLTATGSLDSSFGTGGKVLTNNGLLPTLDAALEPDGSVVVVGGLPDVYRYTQTGSLDTTFGSSGIETGAAESGGLAMITASNGETVMIGKPSSGSGIILQEFHTLANTQRLYVEQDADYNVTSITDTSGNVVERYEYDPYGTVTVLNPNGTVRGTGSLASSFYAWDTTFQGGQEDVQTGQMEFEYREDNLGLGRWDEEDPTLGIYIDGSNLYQIDISNPLGYIDPTGQSGKRQWGHYSLIQPLWKDW